MQGAQTCLETTSKMTSTQISGWIYVVKFDKHAGTNIHKIGRTKYLERRLDALANHYQSDVRVIKTYIVCDEVVAEKQVIQRLKQSFRVVQGLEFFDAPCQQLLHMIKEVLEPYVIKEHKPLHEVEKLCGFCTVSMKFMIKWKNLNFCENSWVHVCDFGKMSHALKDFIDTLEFHLVKVKQGLVRSLRIPQSDPDKISVSSCVIYKRKLHLRFHHKAANQQDPRRCLGDMSSKYLVTRVFLEKTLKICDDILKQYSEKTRHALE